MNDVATRDNNGAAPVLYADSPLVIWAYQAKQAHQIAQSLAKTSFVPATMKGKPDDITAAILAGHELGLQPMAALRSMDIISGTPALRAHAMRALVQSQGHDLELLESTETRCRMRGRRKGADGWQEVLWTVERAKKLGLTDKGEWRKQPQTMLIARATGELCRLVAADVLYAMPYAAEELTDDLAPLLVTSETAPTRPTRRTAQRAPVATMPAPEPDLLPGDEQEPMKEPTGDDPPELDLDDGWPPRGSGG
jgi:hypothetical protein